MKPLFLLFLLLLAPITDAQTLNITVVDSISREPLPFVTVYLKKSGVGMTTNLQGKAQISLATIELTHDTLVCSYISYEKVQLPVDLLNPEPVLVPLVPEVQQVDAVKVTASKKQLTGKQIVKKVLKYTPKNYATDPVNLKALYRETFYEDNHAIYLNEAMVNIHYNKYPQGRFQRRDWKDWFYDDSYAFEFNYSQFDGFPNQFNSDGDRVEIIEARSTENWSKFGFKGSIVGGPLSITSKDYLKYQSDFLDASNFNKYAYKNDGLEDVNGKTCYVVHFYPLETDQKMTIYFGRKIKRSIYVGKMYVDRDSYAVVRMEFKLAQNVDFGFYQRYVPLDYTVEIDYAKRGDIWSLNKVKLTQLRSYKMLSAGKSVLYESEQEVIVTDLKTEDVQQIPLESEWKHTRITTLRDHEVRYNPEYWKALSPLDYPAIPSQVQSELSYKQDLETQFKNRFKQKENLPAPIAKSETYVFNYPQKTIIDEYQWFFTKNHSPEFYQYINEENEYAENFMISNRLYQKNFFNTLNRYYPKKKDDEEKNYRAGQIVFDEDSLGNAFYFEYITPTERKEIMDFSGFTEQRKNCFVSRMKFSKHRIALKYTSNGGLDNHVIILDKGKNEVVDSLSGIYSFEWLNDSTLYYTQENAVKRSDQLMERNINTRESRLIQKELDLTFDISVQQSKSFIFCTVQSMSESEVYALRKSHPEEGFKLLVERKSDVYNTVKEFNGSIYLLTNLSAVNNRVLKLDNGQWKEVIAHDEQRLINDFFISENHQVLHTFRRSYPEIVYRRIGEKKWSEVELPTEIYEADVAVLTNDSIHIGYSSPQRPYTSFLFDLNKDQLTELKRTSLSRPYERDGKFVEIKRLFAKAPDGTKVPITLLKSRSPRKKHKGLILKVYGSYGAFPGGQRFSTDDQILLKDGFTIAYAHVRGGRLMGNQWHNDGKVLNKENTFNDYIACAEYLIRKKYTDSDHLIGYGQSAGGLALGVVLNRRPELFNTVILDHPYLDVVTTMMNDTLPLTTDHYKEVGNPNNEEVFQLMMGYSPYHNIRAQAYPNVLLIAGSNDFQTPAFQVAKFAAKLRTLNTSNNTILFKTDIGSGHSGSTQGNQWMKDLAFMYGFVYGNLFN